jgi:hypothetical protein
MGSHLAPGQHYLPSFGVPEAHAARVDRAYHSWGQPLRIDPQQTPLVRDRNDTSSAFDARIDGSTDTPDRVDILLPDQIGAENGQNSLRIDARKRTQRSFDFDFDTQLLEDEVLEDLAEHWLKH